VSLEFGNDLAAVRAARLAVAPLWADDAQLCEVVALAVSEMVTNAVMHTDHGGQLRVWSHPNVIVEVDDTDPRPPIVSATPSEVGGRGLVIVGRLALEWGMRKRPGGKTVWARFEHTQR
jgi:anti-sigma regulatory factor (Ser/Thr protein kinase)